MMGILAGQFHVLTFVENFMSTCLISFLCAVLQKYVLGEYSGCGFAQIMGGIIWLLPGLPITVGAFELYSNMIVYGSSRLAYGIALTSQLGFGVGVGYNIVFNDLNMPKSFIDGCGSPPSPLPAVILLPLAVCAMSIIINANFRQLPGLVLTSSIGYFVISLLPTGIGVNILASIVVTLTARVYSSFTHERPLVYIYGGLLILTPGGMGMQAMSMYLTGDVMQALALTFKMVMVGTSLAIGMFAGLLVRKSWVLRHTVRHSTILLSHIKNILRAASETTVTSLSTKPAGSGSTGSSQISQNSTVTPTSSTFCRHSDYGSSGDYLESETVPLVSTDTHIL